MSGLHFAESYIIKKKQQTKTQNTDLSTNANPILT